MPENTSTASSPGVVDMIYNIVDYKKLEVMDILRSGAMLAVFLVLMAKGPAKRADMFAVADVLGTAAAGLACYFFPGSYLGYQVTGELDIVHEYLTQVLGASLLGLAWGRYRSLGSRDGYCSVSFTIIRLLGSGLFLMTMLHAQYGLTGSKKMTPQHFSFAIFGCSIWHFSHAIQLYYYSGEGKRAFGSLGGNRRDIHLLIAAVMLTMAGMFHWSFPETSCKMIGLKGFTPDAIHIYGLRLLAVVMYMAAMACLAGLHFETDADKKNLLEGGLLVMGLVSPVMFLYHLKHGLFKYFVPVLCAALIQGGNMFWGYCEWPCCSWCARVFGCDKTKKR